MLTVSVCVAYQEESQGVSLEGLDAVFEVSPWKKILKKHIINGRIVRPRVLLQDDIPLEGM